MSLETCWPTDDKYQEMAIHIRFKLPSRKMYFNVHFTFATQTFGMNRIRNMYHIFHLQEVTMIKSKIKSENTEKEINPGIMF